MHLSLLRGCSDSSSEANPRALNPFLACQSSLHLSWLLSVIKGKVLRGSFYGNCRQLAGQGRGAGSHPMQGGSAHILWFLQHRGLVFSICFTLGRVSKHVWWSSVCSASCPGKAGVIQEEAAADGLDPAVPWDSWWFGISGCGISAPSHCHSTFPEKEMCPVNGYILFRGGASDDDDERKLNTAIGGWTKSSPLFRESC